MTLFTPQGRLVTQEPSAFDYRRMQQGRSSLGRKRKLLALLVILAGSLTFFIPLVTTDVPVADRSDWSPFRIVQEMREGKLPAPVWCETCGEPTVRTLLALPLDVSLSYTALVLGLTALLIPEWPGLLKGIAFIGGVNVLISEGKYRHISKGFAESFGVSRQQVHCGWLTAFLLGSLALLFYISITPSLDRPREDANRPE